ncbi:MAG TPA: methyltransferase domain-containing protein [Steroidobacteraceae bacterium]|nr:methyltransferase domain-containing protein [Steroidobacteraceae bacterium]
MSTDTEWESWGRLDPHYGVLAHERFRRHNLNAPALEEFFRSGREQFAQIMSDCRHFLGPVSTSRALDFGCGVGRLLIPLAETAGSCYGIDVSGAMLREAAENCSKAGLGNVSLARDLSALEGTEPFSFIQSYIVLQHIPAARGLGIIRKLLSLLAEDGVAALHVTYARRKYAYNLGAQPAVRRVIREFGRRSGRFMRRLMSVDPEMQMNAYDVNRIMFLFQSAGVPTANLRFTDHSGNLGVIFYLRRPRGVQER